MDSLNFIELPPEDFCKTIDLFSSLDHVLAIKASLSSSSKGKVIGDHPGHPTLAILWNELDGFYLGTTQPVLDPKIVRETIKNILENHPELLEEIEQFVIYTDPTLDDRLCEQFIPSERFEKRWVKLFKGHEKVQKQIEIPSDYKLITIEQAIIDKQKLSGIEEILDDISYTWSSLDTFTQKGLGLLLIDQEKAAIASCCFAEHAAEGGIEFSIETNEAYQRKGLGKVIGQSMLNQCYQKNLVPYWYCMANNSGSIALANKLGLAEELTFPVWFFEFDN
jgi:RimJ/RimL family protein N-acetyltransferase